MGMAVGDLEGMDTELVVRGGAGFDELLARGELEAAGIEDAGAVTALLVIGDFDDPGQIGQVWATVAREYLADGTVYVQII